MSTCIPLTKNMSNPKPDCPTVIKTSIPSTTKHPRNISPNSKRNTNHYVILNLFISRKTDPPSHYAINF